MVPGLGHRLIIDASRATRPNAVGHTRMIDGVDPARLTELAHQLDAARTVLKEPA